MRIIGLTLIVWLLATGRFKTYVAFATTKGAAASSTVGVAPSGTSS